MSVEFEKSVMVAVYLLILFYLLLIFNTSLNMLQSIILQASYHGSLSTSEVYETSLSDYFNDMTALTEIGIIHIEHQS